MRRLEVDIPFGLTGEGELHAAGGTSKGEFILPAVMALECLWTQTGKLQIAGASIFYRSLWLLQCVQELANLCALPVRCNQCDTVNLSRCGSYK
jgi:hypothetical protein